jgi:hypothetical protein
MKTPSPQLSRISNRWNCTLRGTEDARKCNYRPRQPGRFHSTNEYDEADSQAKIRDIQYIPKR